MTQADIPRFPMTPSFASNPGILPTVAKSSMKHWTGTGRRPPGLRSAAALLTRTTRS